MDTSPPRTSGGAGQDSAGLSDIDGLAAATDAHNAERAAHAQAETNAGVARATGVLALGNIASRVLGLAREVALTNLFGASRAVDAFNYAILVPKTLYDLLIAGHVNGAIIPVLSEVVTRDGQKALWQLVSILLSSLTALLALLVLALEFFAPQVIQIISSGADAATQSLATDLLRLTSPALLFLSLFAILSGTLYALRSFKWPAFAGAVFNATVVLFTILLAPPLQIMPEVSASGVEWLAARPAEGIRAAALGWLLGAVVQLALQLPGLHGARLRLTLRWNHPAIKQIGRLYVPVMFSLIIDTLVRTFSYNLASQTGVGSVSYMNWATTLIQFPQGLVATAISIAILPTLSRQAALIALDHGDTTHRRAFKDTLGLGLRLAITLIVPAAIGLFVLAVPIIDLLFEHGAFTAADTEITALALRLYLIGLPFAAVDLLLVYAFYARQDTLTPALIGLASLLIYTLVAVTLLPAYGLFSLMIADSVKHIVHALVSAFLLNRRIGGFGSQRLLATIGKTALAALVMGLAAVIAEPALEQLIGRTTLLRELALVTVSGGLSVLVFVGIASLFRIEELGWIWGLLRQKLGR
jgi:putative peptidoglycan lipid II flippase